MNQLKLTKMRPAATGFKEQRRGSVMRLRAAIATGSLAALGGCINVSAPEEPIVIELNVNIEARVLYELAESANNTIDENADIF